LRSGDPIGKNAESMRPPFLAALAVATLFAPWWFGCGDGDEPATTGGAETETTSTGPLTKAELTGQANEICSGLVASLESLGPPPDLNPETLTPESIQATSEFWSQSADAGADAVTDLATLEPPKSLEKRWDAFVELYESGMVDYQRSLAEAAESGDRSTFFKAAFRGQKTLQELNGFSASLGLDECQTASASG
jgi:hypothetical protein